MEDSATISRVLARLFTYRHFEQWLAQRYGLILSAVIASGLALLFEILIPFVDNAGVNTLLSYAFYFGISYACWFIGREWYWRSGRGHKVGLAFDTHRIPSEDLTDTRREIRRVIHEGLLPTTISIRAFPHISPTDKSTHSRLRRRYRLKTIVVLGLEQPADSDKPTVEKLHLNYKLTSQVPVDFLVETVRHANALFSNREPTQTIKELFSQRAHRLFDAVLLIVAALEFNHNDTNSESIELLSFLDSRLAEKFDKADYPRVPVRVLWMTAIVQPSRYRAGETTGPDHLALAIERCDLAIQLFDLETSEPRLLQARNYFYANNLTSAVHVLSPLDDRKLPLTDRTMLLLDLFVLSLLQGKWKPAVKYLQRLRREGKAHRLDWPDLITFADDAVAMGFEHAVYMQVLYRKIASVEVSADLHGALNQWLSESQRRAPLRAQLALIQDDPAFMAPPELTGK